MPVNLLLDHILGVRALVAASATFQTMTGSDDATAAAEWVVIYQGAPPDGDVFAVVSDPDESALALDSITGPGTYDGLRSAQFTLFRYVDEWTAADAEQMLEDFSAIVREVLTQQGEDDHLYINRARKVSSQILPFRFVDSKSMRQGYQLAFVFEQDIYG